MLRSVLEHGPVARSTIARLTGLSPASVTDYCARFTRAGLIREAAAPRQSKGVGRPHVPVDLDDSRFVVGGVHVAVPYTTVALLDLRGRVVAERRLKHPAGAVESRQVLARAADGLAALLARAPERRPLGVGVAVGGWVDRDSGTVVAHPLLDWRDVPVRDVVAARTGLPVHVDGHARALVNAERLFGRARGSGSMLHLFVGNVVDAAFATHDEVHHGPRSQAGALGLIPLFNLWLGIGETFKVATIAVVVYIPIYVNYPGLKSRACCSGSPMASVVPAASSSDTRWCRRSGDESEGRGL